MRCASLTTSRISLHFYTNVLSLNHNGVVTVSNRVMSGIGWEIFRGARPVDCTQYLDYLAFAAIVKTIRFLASCLCKINQKDNPSLQPSTPTFDSQLHFATRMNDMDNWTWLTNYSERDWIEAHLLQSEYRSTLQPDYLYPIKLLF